MKIKIQYDQEDETEIDSNITHPLKNKIDQNDGDQDLLVTKQDEYDPLPSSLKILIPSSIKSVCFSLDYKSYKSHVTVLDKDDYYSKTPTPPKIRQGLVRKRKRNIPKVFNTWWKPIRKSKTLLRYVDNIFENHITTNGVDFRTKYIDYLDPKYGLTLQIWDRYRGCERFRSTPQTYYRNASAIFVLFDVTDRESFNYAKEELKGIPHTSECIHEVYIVGNKIDLESKRVISREEAIQFAQDNAAQYYEISAKENIDVHQMFDEVGKALFYKKINDPDFSNAKPTPSAPPPKSYCIIQ
ncbi:hypothetical protein CYY_003009 [Polysphondylium violaceum]|uniref:Rab GTPase n=1 Tax=Polysphondylium violaceum TaxID=133409 RepID=A0A8J4PYD7_9MYCE|nr:hypothetical protein CYY_003009 [Polysphondylium violaceum]